jgi:hypothetical protein
MLQKQMTLFQRELRRPYICAELENFRIYLDLRSKKYVQSEQDRAVKPDNLNLELKEGGGRSCDWSDW